MKIVSFRKFSFERERERERERGREEERRGKRASIENRGSRENREKGALVIVEGKHVQ